MRLYLAFPRPWTERVASGNRRVAILPGAGPTEPARLRVDYGPISPCPEAAGAWVEQVMRSETPPDSGLRMGGMVDGETSAGWRVKLVEAEVLNCAGEVIEARLCALYRLMEHASAVTVRAPSKAALDEHRTAIRDVLRTARPDWRGEPLCLADVWDLEPPRSPAAAATAAVATRLASGEVLRGRGQPVEALAELEAAVALAPDDARAHFLIGAVLDALGRRDESIAAWEQSVALDPTAADPCYALAKARLQQGRAEEALAGFRRSCALEPDNVLPLRDVVRALHALGRLDEGQEARARFRERWATSPDPRVRLLDEYCFDEYARDGARIQVFETLRARAPWHTTLLTFRAVDSEERPLATVRIETGEEGRRSGQPFAIGIVEENGHLRVLATAQRLAPYPDLRATADRILAEALTMS